MKEKKILWSAWIVVTCFYAYQYILRVFPSIFMEDIVSKFQLSPTAFGQFSGVYYLAYSFMHLPVGMLINKFGPKRVLPILIMCTSLGLLPLLFSGSFIYPVLGRFLMGMGSTGAILGVFKVLHMSFPPEKFSRFLSFSVTIGLVGAVYGGSPVHLAKEVLGFEFVLWALIATSVLLSAATFFLIPDSKDEASSSSTFSDLKVLLGNGELLLLCFVAGLFVGPLEGFADVWGVQFLKTFHEIPAGLASGLPSWIFIGMGIGGPLLSLIAEKSGDYVRVVLAVSFLMLSSFILLLTVKMSVVVLSALFLLIGIGCAYQILMIYQVSTRVEERLKGLSSVVSNMIIMIFGYVFHTSIGKCVEHFAGSQELSAFQDQRSLSLAISVIPLALSVGWLALLYWYVFKSKRGRVV
ncbi:MAG: MFS transporter [Oligoflexales bacterium]|nr:MFS transporter [Oligoflexales bacterium]